MSKFAVQNQFDQIQEFKDAAATRHNFRQELDALVKALSPGDSLLLFFSGHGSRVPSISSPSLKGQPLYDEAICLYDGDILDKELFCRLNKFQEGIRILIVLDSCHSGGMLRLLSREEYLVQRNLANKRHQEEEMDYNSFQASIGFIASAKENQLARSGEQFSWFGEQLTEALKSNEINSFDRLFKQLNTRKFNDQCIHCLKVGKNPEIWSTLKYNAVKNKNQ